MYVDTISITEHFSLYGIGLHTRSETRWQIVTIAFPRHIYVCDRLINLDRQLPAPKKAASVFADDTSDGYIPIMGHEFSFLLPK